MLGVDVYDEIDVRFLDKYLDITLSASKLKDTLEAGNSPAAGLCRVIRTRLASNDPEERRRWLLRAANQGWEEVH